MTYDEIQTRVATLNARKAQLNQEIDNLMPTEPDEVYGLRYTEIPIGSPAWYAQQQGIATRQTEIAQINDELYQLAVAELEVI